MPAASTQPADDLALPEPSPLANTWSIWYQRRRKRDVPGMACVTQSNPSRRNHVPASRLLKSPAAITGKGSRRTASKMRATCSRRWPPLMAIRAGRWTEYTRIGRSRHRIVAAVTARRMPVNTAPCGNRSFEGSSMGHGDRMAVPYSWRACGWMPLGKYR